MIVEPAKDERWELVKEMMIELKNNGLPKQVMLRQLHEMFEREGIIVKSLDELVDEIYSM